MSQSGEAAASALGTFQLGPISHISYLVDDLDEAIAFWAHTLSVGPFFVLRHLTFERLEVEGASSDADISIALAWRGDLQIELVQQHDDAPSVFTLYPGTGGGAHHAGIRTADLALAEKALLDSGLRVVQRGVSGAGATTVFFDGGPYLGILELIEVIDGGTFLEKLKWAAAEWDRVSPYAN